VLFSKINENEQNFFVHFNFDNFEKIHSLDEENFR
jgi:hypothetical protein